MPHPAMGTLSFAVLCECILSVEVSGDGWGAAGSGGMSPPADALCVGTAHPWGDSVGRQTLCSAAARPALSSDATALSK